jgi:ATP-dependent RNA helicase DDX1
VTSGKHYYEAEVTDDGLVRVGWSARDSARLDALGTDALSWGYGGTGKKSHGGAFEAFGANGGVPYAKGDVVGCALDCDEGRISFFKNGEAVDGGDGVAFALDLEKVFGRREKNPRAGSARGIRAPALFPAVCLKNAECVLRFGTERGDAFAHAPPSGYAAIAKAAVGQWVAGDDDDDDDEEILPAAPIVSASSPRTPRALIVEPTRELAEQTYAFFDAFATHLVRPTVAAALFVGGGGGRDSKKTQTEALTRGAGCDVAVGTPGRVLDLVESGVLDLRDVRFFVLDEADALLDAGNRGVIERIRARLPGGAADASRNASAKVKATFGRVQTLLFSATLRSPVVRRLAEQMCVTPTWVDLKGYDHVPDAVLHAMVVVTGTDGGSRGGASAANAPNAIRQSRLAELATARTDEAHAATKPGDRDAKDCASHAIKVNKLLMLVHAIDAIDAIELTSNVDANRRRTLIFCRTNFDCERVVAFLADVANERGVANERSWSARSLGGALTNDERRANLAAFKNGQVAFLVCTDVAARGIDVRGVPFLINATLPETAEEYVHRVGRVGRAGAPGVALSLVADVPERVWFVRKKGLKPWLRTPVSAADVKEHTVWLDEPGAMVKIEARLGEEIARLEAETSSSSSLTDSLTRFLEANKARVDVRSGAVVRPEDAAASAELAARLELYAPATRRLAQLEVDAQISFWSLKRKFADA